MAVRGRFSLPIVRGLARGLHVLRALNERPPGGWSPTELADHLEIHRTTLKRLCETLRELDYVSLDDEHRPLQPRGVGPQPGRRASATMMRSSLPRSKSCPDLIETLVWPVFLSIPERHAMVSRLENHHLSPLAFHRTTLGQYFPFHATATGRAYIAACAPEQRRELLRSQLLAQYSHEDLCRLAGAADCNASAGRVRRQ